MQNQDMSSVISSDAKPRLKWTPELHGRFVDAVAQLGGADKATPKGLIEVMGIHGLTLYHLKSHLQKYRLAKSHPYQTCNDNHQEEFDETRSSRDHSYESQNQTNDRSMPIAQALQMQMEVQRKLHEQIEVQRHLQLRIEAQGKYLQSVLKKAQDQLSRYNSSSLEVELAKAELSRLASMVDNRYPSSLWISTDIRGSSFNETGNTSSKGTRSSLESSLTSSENSRRKEYSQQNYKINQNMNKLNPNSALLSLMEMHREDKSGPTEQCSTRKRSGSTISDGNCVEQLPMKRLTTWKSGDDQLRKINMLQTFDLNRHYLNDYDACSRVIDLNYKEVEQSNEPL